MASQKIATNAPWSGFNPASLPPEQIDKWNLPETAKEILGGVPGPLDPSWARICHRRLLNLRNELEASWCGLETPELGQLLLWVLAALISRENVLLIGPPGTAKSEIATRIFQLLGLESPRADPSLLGDSLQAAASPRQWWDARRLHEQRTQKFYHYLLSRFTQPEELFGPIEISLLRQGVLARVNFGLLTGPGVRAAFLDEVFKGSSSILNTLLTLTSERKYFNWGGMIEADLLMLIGASNEMPGGFATGTVGVGASGEDFQTLYAFLDRFPARLPIEAASAANREDQDVMTSHLAEAFRTAIQREGRRFSEGRAFPTQPAGMPSVNDLMFLGRYCFQHLGEPGPPFDVNNLARFREAFLRMAADLQRDATSVAERRVTWSISPRKLKALYKIALAHALIRSPNSDAVELGPDSLRVFNLLWDSPTSRSDLETRVRASLAGTGEVTP